MKKTVTAIVAAIAFLVLPVEAELARARPKKLACHPNGCSASRTRCVVTSRRAIFRGPSHWWLGKGG